MERHRIAASLVPQPSAYLQPAACGCKYAGDDGGHRPIHALSIGRRPPKLHTDSRIFHTSLLYKRRRTYQRTSVSRPARGHLVGPARRAGQPPRRRIHDGQRAGALGWTTRWASRPFWVAAAAMPASNTRAAVNRIGSRAPRRAQDSPGRCSEEVAWENAKLIADLARYPRRRPVEDRREHPRRAGRRQAAPLSPRNGCGGVADACAAGPVPDTAAGVRRGSTRPRGAGAEGVSRPPWLHRSETSWRVGAPSPSGCGHSSPLRPPSTPPAPAAGSTMRCGDRAGNCLRGRARARRVCAREPAVPEALPLPPLSA